MATSYRPKDLRGNEYNFIVKKSGPFGLFRTAEKITSDSGGGDMSLGASSGAGSGGGSRGGGSRSEEKTVQTNNRDALEQAYLDSLRGVGGGYASGIDLANILDTYTQSANVQKKEITDSSASQRQGLLDSLKRFQAETEEARNQQRRAYNASRADLEGQAFMATRRAAQSAAARGLGGSGLQQIAQIQALMNQGAATNELAQANTDTLKAITTAAQNKEEDTNRLLQNLDKETANKLAQIDANTANLQAQLQYNEAVRLEDAKARAAQAAASGNNALAQYNLYKLQQADEQATAENTARSVLAAIAKKGINEINSARKSTTTKGKNKSEAIQNAYNNAYGNLYAALADAALPIEVGDTYADQLLQALNTNYNSKHKYK